MLDLELLGFNCLEAEAVEGVSQVGAVVVEKGEDGGEKESVAEEEGVVMAEERGQAEGSCWVVDCRVGVGEKESICVSEAEEKRKGEAKRRRSEAEKRRSEAEEKGKGEAERRQLGGLEVFSKDRRVAGGGLLGEREAEEIVTLGACRSRESVGADERLTVVGDFEKRKILRDVAEGSHLGEGKGGCFVRKEKTGLVAEKPPNQPHASATDLVEFLGLGSSSDTEEDDLCVKRLGFEKPLAVVADGRRIVEVEASSGRLGECESEGLTEEVGMVRGEMLDPGMLDDEWRQKMLVLNGEEIANSIYHIPKGYHLHLPPEGSFIHDPPEGHVGVYLKHLEFGLRFPLVDEVVQIINRMGLSLGQLTPQSVRLIVAYVWVCRFFRVPPTVDLFRSLHHIASISGAGYWMVVSEPGKLVVWPKKSSTKDWKGRFFFLSYPEGEWPVLRTPGLRPRRRLETDEELLSSRPLAAKKVELKLKKERRAYKHFDFKGGLPSKWLPPAEVIFNDRYLHSLGLIPALPGGAVDWSEEECDKIGLNPDLTAKVPNPSFREADRKMSMRDVAKSLSKATKKMVPVVKSYPGPKRPAASIPEPSRGVSRLSADRSPADKSGHVERGRSEKRRSSPPRGAAEKRRRSIDALVKEKLGPLVKEQVRENDKKWAAKLEKKEQTLLKELEVVKKDADKLVEAERKVGELEAKLADAESVFSEELQAKYMEGWSDGNAFTREIVGEFCPTFDWTGYAILEARKMEEARQDVSPPVDAPDQLPPSSTLQAAGDSPIDIEAP